MKPENKSYKNFNIAIYCTVYDVQRMGDSNWLETSFNLLQKYLKVNKVYLETHRNLVVADKKLVQKVKKFFESRGVKTSGGITTTIVSERGRFETFCYSNPEHREKLEKIARYTAELFDEVILDDFFFTNCKCERCIEAKGKKSWTSFRLEQMEEASQNLVIKPAKEVNLDVNLIIKYPNWYDHFQFLGYHLEAEPKLFDMIYTGTETRDPEYSQQHLQQYQSYGIMRYFENVKPGKNGGGWIDPFGRRNLDRYAEQIQLTLFAKAKEVTLFCYSVLFESVKQADGSSKPVSSVAPVAGNVFENVDSFFDNLGKPYGVSSYKPYHSSGEDFLHNYIGMLGIPIEIVPEFPYESSTVFLTECAKFDEKIVEKIQGQLIKGKTVVITSGLLRALQGKGIENIVEVEYTDKKASVNKFMQFFDVYHSDTDILIPQIKYGTNDSWETITCLDKGNGYPLLLQARYANGVLYILTIPDNFADLYHLPQETLTYIKHVIMKDSPVQVESPSKVCLFTYDNDTFIVESFLPHFTRCNIIINKKGAKLHDLTLTNEMPFHRETSGFERDNSTVFQAFLQPHSYHVYRFE
jgi:hypothetical protein